MNGEFLFYLAASFCSGAIFVSAATIAAERLGSLVGGIIAGFPNTVVIALLFIGIVNGVDAVVPAAMMVPMIVGFSGLFMLVYALWRNSPHHVLNAMAALLTWLVLSTLTFFYAPKTIVFSISVLVICFLIGFGVFRFHLKIPRSEGKKIPLTWSITVVRGVVGGSIICLAVLLARLSGPVLGGIATGFPAIMLSTMLIAGYSNGLQFARSLAEPMFFGGVVNSSAYVIATYFFYPLFGLVLGTIFSLLVALVTALISYQLAKYIIRS
ncbi:MAG: DUF3147 family protein [Gammaproteobacteria bacterium]|nr:DUF3147 family protein [Gammaproteobacteria bacterium]